MADKKEMGRIGQRRYSGVIYEEFLPELRGKRGIETYREMSENDDVIGAILCRIHGSIPFLKYCLSSRMDGVSMKSYISGVWEIQKIVGHAASMRMV